MSVMMVCKKYDKFQIPMPFFYTYIHITRDSYKFMQVRTGLMRITTVHLNLLFQKLLKLFPILKSCVAEVTRLCKL